MRRFHGGGARFRDAIILTDSLISASLPGVDTHGIKRIDPYSRKLEQGGYNPSPSFRVSKHGKSVALIDVDDGPGSVAAYRAMEESVLMAKRTGVGATLVTNSNHFGSGESLGSVGLVR
ncbi:Ldh family oxidoreductase [Natrialbaceae archaeon A-chndr2]